MPRPPAEADIQGGVAGGRISYGQQIEGGWSIHDLRHTALTSLLANNVDLATVSKEWADHYSIARTSRYLHPTRRSQELATDASDQIVRLAGGVPKASEGEGKREK